MGKKTLEDLGWKVYEEDEEWLIYERTDMSMDVLLFSKVDKTYFIRTDYFGDQWREYEYTMELHLAIHEELKRLGWIV